MIRLLELCRKVRGYGDLYRGFVSTKLGLASHHNAVPLLRQLTIVNGGVEGHDDLVLELEPSLPFAAAKTWRIDRLGPDSSMAIPDRDIEPKEGYLADLTECMQASVHLRLRSSTVVVAEQLGLAGASQIAASREQGVVARPLAGRSPVLTTYLLRLDHEPSETLARFIERIASVERSQSGIDPAT